MLIENTPYFNFKPYQSYAKEPEHKSTKDKKSIVYPALGAAAGTGLGILVSSKYKNNKNLSKTFTDVASMLTMAAGANIGGVAFGSIGANKEEKKKKISEAGFQILNAALPMLMVTAFIKSCDKIKALDNKPAKIIGSILTMVLGAISVTKINNFIKKDGEQRKYTIKDTFTNFDDVAATIKIGFPYLEKYIPVDYILPVIYAYNGTRAGNAH